jgi:hypothetical protein
MQRVSKDYDMKLSKENMMEEMEKIIKNTKRIISSKGEAWPTLFSFRMEEDEPEEDWMEHVAPVPGIDDVDALRGYSIEPFPCRPVRSEEDLVSIQKRAARLASDPEIKAVAFVMNVLIANQGTEEDLSPETSMKAAYVGYYTRDSFGVTHKLIPYKDFGPISEEDREREVLLIQEELGTMNLPAPLIPNKEISFVDGLDWNPTENAPATLIPNPFVKVRHGI